MNATYKIPPRAQEIEISACTGVLQGSMMRLVINRDIPALREFHRIGIPLDYALDYSVQKGCMPLIEELLNNFGVEPSETTLLRAMQRGLTIRNMFLARVPATVRHVNSAVIAENFDTANILLDRNVQPNFETVAVLKPTAKKSEERRVFIDRVIATLDQKHFPGSLKYMSKWTSISQFERALDRFGALSQIATDDLLSDCLRAAAPGHARALINRGAKFQPRHLDICGDQSWFGSDNNPLGRQGPVLFAVLETAIEEGCLFQATDDVRHLVRPIVKMYAFSENEEFTQLCNLIARSCSSDMRALVGQFFIAEVGRKQRMNPGRYTDIDVNNLIDAMSPVFARDLATNETYDYEPGRTTPW